MEQQEIQTLRALMEYEAARTEPPEGFPHLPDMPAGRYTDSRFFELEQTEIFKKSWLFAGHLDEIPEPGCYMKWEQAGEPVVLVHTEQGEVKAFYNVCSHRGAPVVTEPKGKRLRLTCKYHGWSYSLDGELKAIKDPEDFRDLDFSCRSLSGIRCETFGKFIFVNFDSEAISLLVVLMGIALCLVSYTNLLTLQLSVVGALLTVVYPFMKRVTHLPQVVLGMAFSWSIPMAFAATVDSLPAGLWWLFCANLLWVVVYDTQYAMVDREDDLEVGIKSTAILFGRADTRIILMLQLLCLACFLATGLSFHLGAVYFVSIALVALLFLRHQRLISDRSREACFQAFNESKWIGFIVVAGLLGHYA